MELAHTKTGEEVLNYYGTDMEKGLSLEQVKLLKPVMQEKFDPNNKSLWKLIFAQFDDLSMKVLIGTAIIAFVLASHEEYDDAQLMAFVQPILLLLTIIFHVIIGVWQENNAETLIKSTKEFDVEIGKVIRQDMQSVQSIPAHEIFPGDLIEVSSGDKVPADIRLLKIVSNFLYVNESILTGEPSSTTKHIYPIPDVDAVNQDKKNILFSGTYITAGKARGIVIGTGLDTAIGKIHSMTSRPESAEAPFRKKLNEFEKQLLRVTFLICVLIWAINIGQFDDPAFSTLCTKDVRYLKNSIALIVSAIPVGLPAIVATIVALGVYVMAKNNVIVRSLPSIETIGCTSVICSNKTDMLTSTKSLSRILLIDKIDENDVKFDHFHICGRDIFLNGNHPSAQDLEGLSEFVTICVMCNDSSFNFNQKTQQEEKDDQDMELALLNLAEILNPWNFKQGDPYTTRHVKNKVSLMWHREFTLEFSRDRKQMSTYCKPLKVSQQLSSSPKMFCKGSPENVLDCCTYVRIGKRKIPLTSSIRNRIMDEIMEYGEKQFSCLVLATVDDPIKPNVIDLSDSTKYSSFESNMTFIGVLGMYNPPRKKIADTVLRCKEAGIRIVVMTGDDKVFSGTICKKVGLFEDSENISDVSLSGCEFGRLSLNKQRVAAQKINLFFRVESSHKSKIMGYLQTEGEICAMIGDDVSDVPALMKAKIRIAPKSGTDIAKSISQIVLTDDDFATAFKAVTVGCIIYNNIKRLLCYLISSNIGKVFSVFLAVLLGLPKILLPVQLLWANLVTNGLPAVALGFSSPDIGDVTLVMAPPRKANEALISRWLLLRSMIVGCYVGAATVGAACWWFMVSPSGPHVNYYQLTHHSACNANDENFLDVHCNTFDDPHPTTMALSVLVIIGMLNAITCTSESQSFVKLKLLMKSWLIKAVAMSMIQHFAVLYVDGLSVVFSVCPLSVTEWMIVLKLSFPVILIDGTLKYFSSKYSLNQNPFFKLDTIMAIWALYFTMLFYFNDL